MMQFQKNKIPTQQGYDLWADDYDECGNPMPALSNLALKGILPNLKRAVVVELGCGTGENLKLYLASGSKGGFGLDYSEKMLAKAKAKPELAPFTLIRHDLRKALPLENEIADLVVFSLVLEHIGDIQIPMSEAKRITKSNGLIFISEMHPHLAGTTSANFEKNGKKIYMESFQHKMSTFINSAVKNGLVIESLREWAPSKSIIKDFPRAKKYEVVSMLFTLQLRKL